MDQVFELKHPIEIRLKTADGERSEKISRVTVRRPKAKDMRIVDDYQTKPMALTLAMIERLTDLEPHAVDELDSEDMEALGDLCLGFTDNGRTTGATD